MRLIDAIDSVTFSLILTPLNSCILLHTVFYKSRKSGAIICSSQNLPIQLTKC